ncbi:MAG: exopolysaccharide biosynthesis polyprenyl glycosylphosphotransferase [Anaerolineales bacterium]
MKKTKTAGSDKGIPVKNVYKPILVSSLLLLSDLFAITLSFSIAFLLRFNLIPIMGGYVTTSLIGPLYILLIIIIPAIFLVFGLYPGHGRIGLAEFQSTIISISLAYTITALVVFSLGFSQFFSRAVFIVSWLFSLVTILSFRLVVHNRGSLFSWWGKPAVIIGDYKDVEKIIKYLRSARRIGYKPFAAILISDNKKVEQINGIPVYELTKDNLQQFRNINVKLAIYTNRAGNFESAIREHIHTLNNIFPEIIFVLADSNMNLLSMTAIDLAGHPSLVVKYNLLIPAYQTIKRIVDLTLCLLSLVITLPLFIVISIILWIDSPGPIFHIQERLGKYGKKFKLYKFRTMVVGAEEKLDEILRNDPASRIEYEEYHKLRNDPRLTRVGRLLRRISFDEYPQIWNVIRGEMSWVGPRAYLPEELSMMEDYAETIHRVVPGLTGWWQVMGRHALTFKERLRLDEYYISNFSLLMDAYILLKTVFIVLSGQGI